MRRSARLRRPVLWGLAGALVAGALVAIASVTGWSSLQAVVPVAVVVFAIFAAIKFEKDEIAVADRRRAAATARQITDVQQRTERRFRNMQSWLPQAAAAAATFSNTPFPLPLDGRWALAWDVAGLLAREIYLARPTTVVELGSGGSSLVIGEQLRRLGAGHLYTLDHDPAYAEKTRHMVDSLGLESWVTVLDAPLVDQEVSGGRFRWYDVPREVRELAVIDVLIVDGPPQLTDVEGTPRYPALPVFRDQLSPTALVFVDDESRGAEKRMLQRWTAEQPDWTLEVATTSKGTALLRRTPSKAVPAG